MALNEDRWMKYHYNRDRPHEDGTVKHMPISRQGRKATMGFAAIMMAILLMSLTEGTAHMNLRAQERTTQQSSN